MQDDVGDDFLEYVRKNQERIKRILKAYTPDQVLRIRRTFAENGTEMTPDEVENLMDQLAVGLMMIQAEDGGMSDLD